MCGSSSGPVGQDGCLPNICRPGSASLALKLRVLKVSLSLLNYGNSTTQAQHTQSRARSCLSVGCLLFRSLCVCMCIHPLCLPSECICPLAYLSAQPRMFTYLTHVHIEVYTHISYTYRHIHTYIHTYIQTYIHTYIHTCIHIIHTYIYMVPPPPKRSTIYIYIYIYTYTYTNTYIYIHTCVCI